MDIYIFIIKSTLKKSCPIAVSSNEVIEQVSDYEFFMVSDQSVEKELCVVNLSGLGDDELDVHYQRFEHCYSLSDDFLLFKDPNKTIKYDVYSIKSRGNLKGFSWLSTGYDISAIDLSGDGNRNIVLYVEKKLESQQEKAKINEVNWDNVPSVVIVDHEQQK